MATAIRRARTRRADTATASVALVSLAIVIYSTAVIADAQPLAIIPLGVTLTVLALVEWVPSRGFVIATSLGVAAIALGCAGLAAAS